MKYINKEITCYLAQDVLNRRASYKESKIKTKKSEEERATQRSTWLNSCTTNDQATSYDN